MESKSYRNTCFSFAGYHSIVPLVSLVSLAVELLIRPPNDTLPCVAPQGGVINMGNGDDLEDGPVTILRSSTFMHNQATLDNGGVVNVGSYGILLVEGTDNEFRSNRAIESGGVFAATTDTTIIVEGGRFIDNMAHKVRRDSPTVAAV